MPVKDLRIYLDLCKAMGQTPTWEGLRTFRDRGKLYRKTHPHK